MPPRPSTQPRVLLLWPGALSEPSGNFGVPQMLNLAQYLQRNVGAAVSVVDLDMERATGGFDLATCGRFDVVGLSCYSSFDYLKVMAIARAIKALHPHVTLATGGYHPSARPSDFTRADSPFDAVIVGDGELPMARLVRAVAAGESIEQRVFAPEALDSPREVMPYDWSLLDRYRPIARQVASQAEIYLSRGCPYDCSFCMERAKRETAWRAIEPDEAVEELHRLDAWLDLRGWTLRVVDPLFGMKRSWRRTFLELLARRPVRARKLWLLIRVDLVEEEDFALMARCNVAPGFGLESGDPAQLRRIRKTGMLSGYLDKMLEVGEWARKYHVPFGANIIAGHPGETETTLRNSAAFVRKLFLDPKGSLGFLSVDPFRLYPGSPIDEDLPAWQTRTGLRANRYPWWEDGDQDFLAEWIDPSYELDYARRHALTQELFAPILSGLRQNFRYQGPAADYFKRAVDAQLDQFTPESQSRNANLQQLWTRLAKVTPRTPKHGRTGVVRLPLLGTGASASVAQSTPVAIDAAETWLALVFHVLAHVDVGAVPASVHRPAYVRYAEQRLGPASERALGEDAATLRELIRGHAQYTELQLLAWLYPDVQSARADADRDLCDLSPEKHHHGVLLRRLQALGPVVEVLRCAALLEAPHFQRLEPLPFEPGTLQTELARAARAAPWLSGYRVRRADSLTRHGRVWNRQIWVGTPHQELDVAATHVAWQVAHEATVSELQKKSPTQPERELEGDAIRLLRSHATKAGMQDDYTRWLSTWA
jgi:radical SAM superfamily enzyme YgiQ (UPF0313 family)